MQLIFLNREKREHKTTFAYHNFLLEQQRDLRLRRAEGAPTGRARRSYPAARVLHSLRAPEGQEVQAGAASEAPAAGTRGARRGGQDKGREGRGGGRQGEIDARRWQ